MTFDSLPTTVPLLKAKKSKKLLPAAGVARTSDREITGLAL